MEQRQILVFDRSITLTHSRDFGKIVSSMAQQSCQTALFCNVHMLMLSQKDIVLTDAMDQADWVFADGTPVAWLQRRISKTDARVIEGYELLLAICSHSVLNNEKIGLLGSTHEVLNQLAEKLTQQFDGLDIVFSHAPEFMPGELVSPKAEIERINASGVDWLFVGLGCPKQEKWIAKYHPQLDCHVLGVGAAFDWLAGATAKPPIWMKKAGIAWLYRLFQNPRRMWYRYLFFNSQFIFRSVKLLTWDKLYSSQLKRPPE